MRERSCRMRFAEEAVQFTCGSRGVEPQRESRELEEAGDGDLPTATDRRA